MRVLTREEVRTIKWYDFSIEPELPYAKVLLRIKEGDDSKIRYYVLTWVSRDDMRGFYLNGEPVNNNSFKHSVYFKIGDVAEYMYLTDFVDGEVVPIF